MNNLLLLKNEQLIPVTENETGDITVSGRDVHAFLEIKTEYAKWFERMTEYGFTENQDFAVIVKNDENHQVGRPSTDHIVKLDMAKELCMIQRNEKGRQARQYFIAVEKAWNSPEMIMKRALEFANKKVLELQDKIELDKPKVEFADHIATSNNSMLVREVAKIISKQGIEIGERRLYKKLREWGWVFKNSCEATQEAIKRGYMEVSETVKQISDNKKITFKTSRVTGKGQVKIYEKLKAEQTN